MDSGLGVDMKYIDCDDGDESFDRMRDDRLTDAADHLRELEANLSLIPLGERIPYEIEVIDTCGCGTDLPAGETRCKACSEVFLEKTNRARRNK